MLLQHFLKMLTQMLATIRKKCWRKNISNIYEKCWKIIGNFLEKCWRKNVGTTSKKCWQKMF
jgi:hypothetical protein